MQERFVWFRVVGEDPVEELGGVVVEPGPTVPLGQWVHRPHPSEGVDRRHRRLARAAWARPSHAVRSSSWRSVGS